MSDPTPVSSGPQTRNPPPPQEDAQSVLYPPPEPADQPEPSDIQLWMHRISVFLFVLVSAVAGVLLIILPWTPEWTDNYILLTFPSLRPMISSGFFRGVCTGLGLLDIWIGFWEALHYHELQ
jgi:hypothetical protein